MTQNVADMQPPGVALIEFSVVLLADNLDPSMINPDFLRHSGIVDPDLQTEQPPVSTPAFSQIVFEGGVAVMAQPDRINFIQRGEYLKEEHVIIQRMARRFPEKIPYPAYKAVGINPTGVRPLGDGSIGGVASTLIEGGRWLAFEGVSPAVYLKVAYPYQDRQITMDIHDAKRLTPDGSEASGLLFAANIHRDIRETDQPRRIARLMSILSGWKDDLSDFRKLVTQFNLQGAVL